MIADIRRLATRAADSKGIRGDAQWRRRESNVGPAMSQESAGASRRAVSGAESGVCGDSGESASALETAGESGACSNMANGPTRAELVELGKSMRQTLRRSGYSRRYKEPEAACGVGHRTIGQSDNLVDPA